MNNLKITVMSLLILSATVLVGCSKPQPETEQIPYVMVTQPNGSDHRQQSYAGEVIARQETALAFRVAGQVTDRYVNVGDHVKVGQVLAKLDVKDAQLQLNSAQAQLQSAQSAVQNAADEYKRFQQLLPSKAVSQSQFDAVKNQYEAAKASLKQAQANHATASNQTQYNQLLANKNGVITQREIEVGQVVAAGQAVYHLAIDGEREVSIGVPEQALKDFKVGQAAQVSLWSQPEQMLKARIREISPAADKSRTYSVKVSLEEGQSTAQLGQSARVFFNWSQAQQLSVPLSSVSANGQQAYVWVVNPDQSIRQVKVTLGEYGRDRVPVLSGLNAQDWVVVGGVHLLRAQQKIHPVDRNNRAVTIANTNTNTNTNINSSAAAQTQAVKGAS